MKEKLDPINELPETVNRYIDRVIKKMRYRRKVRDEVRRELTDHFVDALKDCKSENDRQELATSLIEGFGDAKLLARLIRRGKKRCRPMWKKAIIRSLQATGILIVLLIVYVISFVTDTPTINVDYLSRWNESTRPSVAEADNAWPLYEKAIELYVKPDESIEELVQSISKKTLERSDELNEQDQVKFRQWLKENQHAWDNLDKEAQEVIQTCLKKNYVPDITYESPLPYPFPRYNPKNDYINYLRKKIIESEDKTKRPLGYFQPNGIDISGLLHKTLSNWMKNETIPTDFETAVDVAVVREWIRRTGKEEKIVFENFSETQFKHLKQWLKDNEPAWREYITASRKPYFWWKYGFDEQNQNEDDHWLLSVFLPHLSPLREISKQGTWRARMAAYEGNIDSALADSLAIVRTGRHLQKKNSTLIEQLVGLSISYLGHHEIIRLAGHVGLTKNDLEQTQRELEHIYSPVYPLMDIAGEKLMFLDTVQHCFTDGGIGGGHIVPKYMLNLGDFKGKDEGLLMTGGCLLHARRDETEAKAIEIYDRMNEAAILNPYQKKTQNIDIEKYIVDLPYYRYLLIRMMIPALDRASDIAFKGKVDHEATVTILALRRWRLETGSYPDDLNDLVKNGYIKLLPDDPYSDGPLRYEKRGDDFVLYSLGEDFDDDGGVQSPENEWGRVDRPSRNRAKPYTGGDRVFWPVEAE